LRQAGVAVPTPQTGFGMPDLDVLRGRGGAWTRHVAASDTATV
jgi:hypothetical protein